MARSRGWQLRAYGANSEPRSNRTEVTTMAAIAQPHSTTALPVPSATHRNGLHTAVLATVATLVGALILSILMALSVMFAGPSRLIDTAPLAEPVPQPSAAYGLDR
jgi:hypothetical protein